MKTTLTPQCLRLVSKLVQPLLKLEELIALDADRVPHPTPLPDGYELFVMTPDLLRHHACNPRNELDATMAYLLLFQLDFCIGVRHEDRLAGYAWYAFGPIEADPNAGRRGRGAAMSFPADTVFLQKTLILPEHRGRDLEPSIHANALRILEGQGVRRILTTADWANAAARRTGQLGFQCKGRIWRFGLGKLAAAKYPRAARKEGIRFGARAVRERRPLRLRPEDGRPNQPDRSP